MVLDPALHVLDQTQARANSIPARRRRAMRSNPSSAPAPISFRRRRTIRSWQAGYPLMIFARDKAAPAGPTRIAILEMDNGQLRLRSVGQAGFTPEMTSRIQHFLDASLPEFGKTSTATHPTH